MHLRDWLKITGTQIKDFASVLKISRGHLHEILRGKKLPSRKILKKIFDFTMGRVSVEGLKDGSDEVEQLDEKDQHERDGSV